MPDSRGNGKKTCRHPGPVEVRPPWHRPMRKPRLPTGDESTFAGFFRAAVGHGGRVFSGAHHTIGGQG